MEKMSASQIMRELYCIEGQTVLEQIDQKAISRVFRPDDIIVTQGSHLTHLHLLVEGIIRASYVSGKGEEHTDHFLSVPGNPILSPDPSAPMLMTFSAVTEVRMILLPISEMLALEKEYPQLLVAYNRMVTTKLMLHWQIKVSQYCYSAAERYAWFKEAFPEVLAHAKGKYVASFLGITPETLSRIRKEPQKTERYPLAEEGPYGTVELMLQAMMAGKLFKDLRC